MIKYNESIINLWFIFVNENLSFYTGACTIEFFEPNFSKLILIKYNIKQKMQKNK